MFCFTCYTFFFFFVSVIGFPDESEAAVGTDVLQIKKEKRLRTRGSI